MFGFFLKNKLIKINLLHHLKELAKNSFLLSNSQRIQKILRITLDHSLYTCSNLKRIEKSD